jgi:hypothetical protein
MTRDLHTAKVQSLEQLMSDASIYGIARLENDPSTITSLASSSSCIRDQGGVYLHIPPTLKAQKCVNVNGYR